MATILIIDDEEPIRALLRTALEAAGHQMVEATNGRVGLDLYRLKPTDLIITDILMPEMEGIEFILKLRKESPSVPIIAISGSGRSSTIDYLAMARRLGATAVLEKPFGREELLGVVAKALAS